MPEDRNGAVDRPLSTTPEAAVLRQIFWFLLGNWFWLAGGVAAGVMLGLAAQRYLPRTYEAQGSFVVDEVPFLQNSADNKNLPDHATEDDLVQSLILGIPSLPMRSAMAERLGVGEKQICFVDISARPLSLKSKEPVANIRISSVRNTRTGTITITSQSADFAAQAANALLDELGNYNRAQGRLNALDMDRQVTLARVENIHTQLAQQDQSLDYEAQQVAQLDEYVKQGLPLESFPQFVADVTLNNLKTERLLNQAEYAGLASSSSGGLQLERKKAQVADINKGIEQQAQKLAEGQRSQLIATRIQEQNLHTELDNLLQKIQQFSHDREKWVLSFGDITQMKKMIADDANGRVQGGSTIVVVNRAVPAERARSPKLWLNLVVGVFVGTLAGLLIAITRTLLDDRLVSPRTVAALTSLPCLATTHRPEILPWHKKNHLLPQMPASPVFNPLRSRLLLAASDAKAQIIGFTPARKQETASQVVADLAKMLSRAGRRTLVVDLHYSKPRQFSLLGIKPQRGLAEWMASCNALEDYLWPAELEELALLSCEPNQEPVGDLATRRPLARVLPQFENSWDFILIDAPAIASCWDLMLTLPAGGTLIVTASRGRTRARQVVQTATFARDQNWTVAGVALQDC